MTVQSQTSRADYNGNGATTVFAVPFYFLLDTDLQVIRTDNSTTPATVVTLVLNSGYTVAGAGNPAGGSINATIAPTSTQRLSILRSVPYTQLKHYVPNDPFPAASHEMGLDKLTMEVQQLAEVQSRALTLAPNTTGTSTVLPTPEANALIGWDSNADALQNVDPSTMATIVAFGTANADQFTGNGAQKDFVLSANPGVLANLDVSISGVTQLPGIDYGLSTGTTISFLVAPPNGMKVLVRYMQGLPQAYNPDLSNSTDPAKGAALVAHAAQSVANVAALRLLLKTSASQWARTSGYYTKGDGGSGDYYLDPADTSTVDNGGTVIVAADGGRWKLAWQGMVNVLQFGAKGNGVADDTVALQNAINWAQVIKAWLFFPAVTFGYLTTGLTIGVIGANHTCHFQGGGFDPSGAAQSGITGQFIGMSLIKLLAGNNQSLITILRDAAPPQFQNITFNGNGGAQTGTSHCINCPDTTAQPYYTYAVWMRDCFVQQARNSGIFIGAFRGTGNFRNVWVQFCGTTTADIAVNCRSFDQIFDQIQIGPNTGIGMAIGFATQVQLNNCVMFMNFIGLQIAAAAGSIQLENCVFDSNQTNGVQDFGAPTGSIAGFGSRTFTGCTWNNNGTLTTNTYSDLLCDSDRRIVLVSPTFNGNNGLATVPKYNIEFAATAQTALLTMYGSCQTATTGTINGTAFSNDFTKFNNSYFGQVYLPQDNGNVQTACRMFAGTGAPNNANGSNGDYYHRSDTPGTANQRIYVKSAGVWVGII